MSRKYGSCMDKIRIGDTFGFLIVERKDEIIDNHRVVTLRCSHCGEIKHFPPSNFLHDIPKTCGNPSCTMAYKAETASRKAKATGKISLARKIEHGQAFGMLTVQEVGAIEPKTGAIKIKVICECGEIRYFVPSALLRGVRKTCGSPRCTKEMKSRTYGRKNIRVDTETSAEQKEREFYVRNKLPVGEYVAGCFENLK